MGVLILGMHRSGTSALTRVVNLLGFAIGPEEDLVAPTEANPAGHWEVEALRAFNEDLLLELGGKWSAPPAATPAEVAALAAGERGERGRALLEQTFGDAPWVWKDPRLCLLLPFWRAVLATEPVIVTAVRNPLEIADSLARRNGFLPGYSMALWERYERRAVLDAEGLPVHAVDYARLLAEPASVWEALDRFFIDHHVARSPAGRVEDAEGFLDPTLHRQRRQPEELGSDPAVTAAQLALWEQLSEGARASRAPDPQALAEESPGLQLLFDEHKRMTAFEDAATQQREAIAELQESNETLQRWLEESREDAAHAWSEVRRLEADYAELAESKAMVMDHLEEVLEERERLRAIVDRIKRFLPMRLIDALRKRGTTRPPGT